MTPTKKTAKTKVKTAPKKAAAAKPTRSRAARGASKASEAAADRASPRVEPDRRRSSDVAATRAREKDVKKALPARKERPAPARKSGARGDGRSMGRGVIATGDAKAKLGVKHACFKCGAKFYDLNKPEPLCPKCGADQRERPKVDPRAKPAAATGQRRPTPRPMAPLLEDEEEDEVVVDDDLDLGLEAGDESPDDFLEEEEEEPEEPGES